MEPGRDDLDRRLRRAAEADPAAVDRVVSAALASRAGRVVAPAWPRAVAALGVCLVAAVALAAWWIARQAMPPPGVYRVEALPAATAEVGIRVQAPPQPGGRAPAPQPPADRCGVYRVDAVPSPAPSHVIRVMADDGATWIVSTNAGDALPPGKSVIVGGGEAR
jgi:hypothetical protein